MNDKKPTNNTNAGKRPAPPPVAPKKETQTNKKNNKKILILVPIIVAILVRYLNTLWFSPIRECTIFNASYAIANSYAC